jgi:cell division topological specificity factor
MSIFSYFRTQKKTTSASVAKERLQIIVAHERNKRSAPDYIETMQREILDVIRKYVDIDDEQVKVNLDNNEECSILELNVTLPD